MDEKKELEPSSKHLKEALKVKVRSDKDGKPILVKERFKRGILKAKIKGVWKVVTKM